MTLDEFQAQLRECAGQMRAQVLVLIEKGMEAKLEPAIMLAIINREFEKAFGLETG
jgi:hypothetical protein